jgi:hypothetical protein
MLMTVVCILLAGCGARGVYYSASITKGMTAEESDKAQCRSLGFVEGTSEFANCRYQIKVQRNIELNSAYLP